MINEIILDNIATLFIISLVVIEAIVILIIFNKNN